MGGGRQSQAYIKYNEVLAFLAHFRTSRVQAVTYNKQLRERIDNLRRERLMFESIDAQLDRDLGRIRHDIADSIAAANEVRGTPYRIERYTGLALY